MAKPLIDLYDDSLFSSSASGGERRGLSRDLAPSGKINLNDDTIFKDQSSASEDVVAERYRAMYGYSKPQDVVKPKGLLQRADEAITRTFGTNQADPNEIDAAGVARVKQEEADRQVEIEALRRQNQNRTPLQDLTPTSVARAPVLIAKSAAQAVGMDRFAGALGSAERYLRETEDSMAAGMAGFVGSTTEYLGRQFGIKTLEDIGKKAQIDAAALTPKEQDIIQKVAGGVGSMLPMAASAVATGGTATAAGATPAMASLLATIVGTAAESPSIGQEAYEGALGKTGNEAVAERQGYKAVAYNLPLSFITNKLGFLSETGSRVAQAVKSVIMEGLQEGSQKALTNVMGYQPTGQGVSEEALIGGLAGGLVKQATYGGEKEAGGPKPDAGQRPAGAPAGDQQGDLGRSEKAAGESPMTANLSFDDMSRTLQTKPAVAAVMYQDAATEQEREMISRAVDRAGIREQFTQALADPKLIEDVRNEMAQFPEFIQKLSDSIPDFVNNMPPAGVVKFPGRRSLTEQDIGRSMDDAWNDPGYQQQMQEEQDRFDSENGKPVAPIEPAVTQPTQPAQPATPPAPVEQGVRSPSDRERNNFGAWAALDFNGRKYLFAREGGQYEVLVFGRDNNLVEWAVRNIGDTRSNVLSEGRAFPEDISPRMATLLTELSKTKVENTAQRDALMGQIQAEASQQTSTSAAAPQVATQATPQAAPQATSQAATFAPLTPAEKLARLDSSVQSETFTADDYEIVSLPKELEEIAAALGIKVYGFRSSKSRLRGIASNDSNEIFVNVGTKVSQRFLVGHEVFHQLEMRDPKLAKELAETVVEFLRTDAAARYKSQLIKSGYKPSELNSEIAADVFGVVFMEEAFWIDVGRKNPSLLQRALDMLDKIFSDVGDYIANNAGRAGALKSYIKEWNTVRDLMSDYLAEMQQRQATIQEQGAEPRASRAAPDSRSEDDVKAYNKVMTLLRDGNKASIGQAAKLFREAKLFDKGFGNFTEMQREARVPLLEGRRVTERVRYGTGVRVTAEGKQSVVENVDARMPGEAFRPDEGTVEDVDQAGANFKKVYSPRKEEQTEEQVQPAERPQVDMAKPARGESDLRQRFDQFIRNSYRIKFFDDTILALNAELDKIDRQLKELNTLRTTDAKGNEAVYRATEKIDENAGLWGYNDENSYDRLSGGFRPDKATTREFLLDTRRKIAEDLQYFRDRNVSGRARLYRRGVARMFKQIRAEADRAIRAGFDPDRAEEIYNEYFSAYSLKVDMRGEQIEDSPIAPSPVDPNVDIDGTRVAMNVIGDARSSRSSEREELDLIQRGIRDGDFTFNDVIDAYRGMKLSPPRSILDTTIQLSIRKRLADHMAENGHSTASRLEWLTSMRKTLKANPSAVNQLTRDEYEFYNFWLRTIKPIISRRAVTEAMKYRKTAKEAFPGLLFNRYTLSEASARTDLGRLLGDTRESWLQDVAYALRRRPDLEYDILTSIGDDSKQFEEWIRAKKNAIAKESKLMAKAPGFAELRNIFVPDASLESISPEGRQQLSSLPIRDETAGREDTGPSRYEEEYVKLANAELFQVPDIMDSIARLNAILTSKVDPETGEIFTDAQAEEAAAEVIDSLEFQATRMGEVEYIDSAGRKRTGSALPSDAPSAIQRGETGFEAGTREINAEIVRRPGATKAEDLSDESSADLIMSGADISMGDNMFEIMNGTDEDVETEYEGGEQEEIAAEEKESTKRAKIPSSVAPDYEYQGEYRFKRGPFNGVLVPSMIAEHLAKITAKWIGAPKINVVQNIDHLPPALRDKVKARLGKHMGAKGLYHNGEVYIFSDFISTIGDAEFVLFHESYGHFGMRAFLGADFDSFLQRTYDSNPKVKEQVDQLMSQEPIGVLEATDEVLADMAGDNKPVSAVKAWTGKIIAGLRKIGMTKVAGWMSTKTDAEIAYVLKGARDAVKNGTRTPFNGAPDDVRLAEARLPYELFSSKNGKTTAYARYNPVTGTWAVFTATGDDIRQGWGTEIKTDFEDVMSFMKKNGVVERRTRSGLYIDNKIPSDLQKIPEFRVDPSEIGFSKEGIKTLGRLIKRNATILFQNEYKAAFDVVEYLRARGRISESFDLVPDLEGNHERRTGAELDQARKDFERPLMALVKELGKMGANTTLRDAGLNLPAGVLNRVGDSSVIDAYLVAMHAEERNKQIANINPLKPDGGSGMFTSDANTILAALSTKPYANTLSEVSRILRDMSEYKLNRMVEAGSISLKEAQKRANYKNYVNLSGLNEGLDKFDDPGVLLSGGSKFATKKDKRAMGRGTMAADVLARTILSFEAGIINANKNEVKKKVLALFEVNYDPDFVSINKQAYKRVFDENGQVTEQIHPDYIKDKKVMVVHVNGIPITVEFKQTGFGTFADAIHGSVYPPQASAWPLRAISSVNQVIGQMLTTWNPVWSVINYVRDVQNLYANAVADKRVTPEMAKQMVMYLKQARHAAFHHATEGRRGQDATAEMLRYYKEMREAGGATSFMDFRGLESKMRELETLLANKDPNQFMKVVGKVFDTIEAFNIPLEMAPRIAAYRVMKENGYSNEQAAAFAGEITVNFNMRGSAKWARQAFLFFNPAVQGSAKFVKLATTNPKIVAKMAGGMAALGFIVNILARAMGGDDDDGTSKLDGIPVYKRATNILLPNPLGSPPFIAVPIPYGWNAFYAAGHFMADTMYAGTQSAGTTAKRILQSAFESFSPIGSAGLDSKTLLGTIGKAVTPTPLLAIIELWSNENRFGAPITKQEGSAFSQGKRANSEMAFDSASPISSAIFKGLNKLTGGDRVNSGLIDVNPGVIDYLIRSYVPGVGAEIYNFASWATAKALGYDTKEAKIPLVDRLTASSPEGQDFGRFRRAEELILTKYDDFRMNKGNREEILKEYPNLGAAKAAIAATKTQVNKLREVRSQLDLREDLTSEQRVDLYNRSRKAEKEVISRAVRRIMETNPSMRQAILASE
jgi:hypothetical protein